MAASITKKKSKTSVVKKSVPSSLSHKRSPSSSLVTKAKKTKSAKSTDTTKTKAKTKAKPTPKAKTKTKPKIDVEVKANAPVPVSVVSIPITPPKPKTSRRPKPKDSAAVLVPVLNIGTVGQIDHGKTTLTKAITNVWTDRHSEELKRGMTIRLGYADITMRKCPVCAAPACFTTKKTHDCGEYTEAVRTVSFVDAPGHEALMSIMLSGAAIMDGAILVIAANEPCPQPQTKEHVIALQISGIKNIIVVQNKIDLVSDEVAEENHKQILSFLAVHGFKTPVVIPASAQHGVNIDYVLAAINEFFPTPERDTKRPPKFLVARSFDVNKPGMLNVEDIKGGILGGALIQGSLSVGQDIEILPGYRKNEANKTVWIPIKTVVSSLFITESTQANRVTPGGTVGIGTLLDPAITKSDALAGSVVGRVGKLPPLLQTVRFNPHLLERVVGSREELEVTPIIRDEHLLINVNASVTTGVVTMAKKDLVEVLLRVPVCIASGERLAISRKIKQRWRLIGHGIIVT